jgi:predicted dehydrogenase
VRVIGQLPNSKLVAVCDPVTEHAQKALDKYHRTGVPIYGSQREMLEKEQIDVVHIATPSGNHMDPVLTAIDAGKNVICEKPLEIQLDRIDKMNEAASKKGVRLAGIFQNRWNNANRTIKQAVDEGRFGKIAFAGCYTPWYRSDQYYREGGWRGTWALDGGGAIMNQSVHAVDLLQWIAGPVKTVSAYAASRIHPEIEVEDTLACSLQFQSGAFGVIMGTTAMYPGGAVRLEIGGADGMAVSENGLKTFKFRNAKEDDKQLTEQLNSKTATAAGTSAVQQGTELHNRNITAILDAWEKGQEPETSGVEARKAIAIILAMYESAKKGGVPVEVK